VDKQLKAKKRKLQDVLGQVIEKQGVHHTHNTHRRTRHDTTRHDTTRHDTTRHDTTRHDTTRHDTTRHDTRKDSRLIGWQDKPESQAPAGQGPPGYAGGGPYGGPGGAAPYMAGAPHGYAPVGYPPHLQHHHPQQPMAPGYPYPCTLSLPPTRACRVVSCRAVCAVGVSHRVRDGQMECRSRAGMPGGRVRRRVWGCLECPECRE
jgi:hypothetical protein